MPKEKKLKNAAAEVVRLKGGGTRRAVPEAEKQIPSLASVSFLNSAASAAPEPKKRGWLGLFCCSGTGNVVEPQLKIQNKPEPSPAATPETSISLTEAPPPSVAKLVHRLRERRIQVELRSDGESDAEPDMIVKTKSKGRPVDVMALHRALIEAEFTRAIEMPDPQTYLRSLAAKRPDLFNDWDLDESFQAWYERCCEGDGDGEVDGPSMLSVG